MKAKEYYTYCEVGVRIICDDKCSGKSPCCRKLSITAEENHGVWMIHFNKLGSYTITNTLVHGRNTWVSDTNPEFVITWCGEFWHIGHREEAGECAGYLASSDNTLCFHEVKTIRHYVHCIKEWVNTEPSNLRVECQEDVRDNHPVQAHGPSGQIKEFQHRVGHKTKHGGVNGALHEWKQNDKERDDQLQLQKDLDIDPRNIPV